MAAPPPVHLRRIGVPGVRLGHATAVDRSSGVTVALFAPPAAVVVDVRGGASCTYDTASLSVDATFGRRWALFLAGGSVHGLDAARGVRTALLSAGGGYRPFRNPNRIVPVSGATLFDLPAHEGPIVDYLPLGFEAVREARADRVAIGRVGAGSGATVGKYLGRAHAMPGGLGYATGLVRGLGVAAALVVLNSVGAVREADTGRWLAGARIGRGRIVPPSKGTSTPPRSRDLPRGTNLVLVLTDVTLDRSGLHRVAQQAHDGLARAVVPAHTATDGDVVFSATTNARRASPNEPYPGATADRVGAKTAELVAAAAAAAVAPGQR